MSESTTETKQPATLKMLFFSEMWERFSFYGMRALLVLYLSKELFEHLGEQQAEETAYGIYAAYGALVYATPFLGGVIADRLLGYKKAVMLGSVLMALGHFAMAIENQLFLYIALSLLIIGNGFFKPNISSMVGGQYHDNDARRDGGFTIFYMGINLGAMIAPLACGTLGEMVGWWWGFSLAGVGMVLGLVVFTLGKHRLGENGDPPNPELLKKKLGGVLSVEHAVYVGAFLSVAAFAALVWKFELMTYVLTPFAAGVVLIILVAAIRREKVQRERLFVILVLLFFSTLFWAFFEQAGSSMTLFTDKNVDKGIFTASMFQAVNPFFILVLALPFSWTWVKLANIGKEPNVPVKFALGIAQLGVGFLVLGMSAGFITQGEVSYEKEGQMVTEAAALVPVAFLLLGYLLHTTGELCLSPIGLSMVTKLSPKEMTATVMGGWFLSSAMAHHIAGIIAKLTTVPATAEGAPAGTLAVAEGLLTRADADGLSETLLASYDGLASYCSVFMDLGWVALGASVLLLLLSPVLKKWMHGVT